MSTTTTPSGTTTYTIDPAHTTVEFIVRHLMISKVRGRFRGVTGTLQVPAGGNVPSSVEVVIDTTTIDTHEPQRDDHLRSPDFLEAANFPQMTFRSTGVEGDGEEFKINGDLTIHGVTRPVVLDTTFEGSTVDPWGNQRLGYSALTKISRKDFGMQWNVALEAGGVTVGDEVKIDINLEAILQK
jgi:polyisoprenoid-binding protein YceI